MPQEQGKLKRRRIRANQNNLSLEERQVKRLMIKHNISSRDAWKRYNLEMELRSITDPQFLSV